MIIKKQIVWKSEQRKHFKLEKAESLQQLTILTRDYWIMFITYTCNKHNLPTN